MVRVAGAALGVSSILVEPLTRLVQRCSPGQRHRAIAWTGGTLVHLVMFLALAATQAERQIGLGPSDERGGQVQAHNGQVLSPILVSLMTRDALGRDPTHREPAQSPAGPPGAGEAKAVVKAVATPDVLARAGGGGPSSSAESDSTSPSSPASAPAVQGQDLQAAVQSGSLDGARNLLRQIARCLPPDRRPVITGAVLAVHLDEAGALSAAPNIDMSLALASRETIEDANLVIQAALLCGPYQGSEGGGAAFSLAPDFSFLGVQTIAAGSTGQDASHGR